MRYRSRGAGRGGSGLAEFVRRPGPSPTGPRSLDLSLRPRRSHSPVPRTAPSPPTTPLSYDPALERVEIELLLEGIYRHYGFDFRSYAYASIRRRLWKRIEAEGLRTVSALQERVLHDQDVMNQLLLDLSINVTAMFRDPTFHVA